MSVRGQPPRLCGEQSEPAVAASPQLSHYLIARLNAAPRQTLIKPNSVIPSEAELPFFGNSAQLRDLVFALTILD